MFSDSCHWISAEALISDINDNQLNVTNLVAQCINICTIAFESKGPRHELLGPGIMISAALQGILCTIFGISLPGIIWIINKLSPSNPSKSAPLLRNFRTALIQTNALVVISFLLAARITRNDSPILERTFISSLVDIQLWCVLGIVLSEDTDKKLDQPQVSWVHQFGYYALAIAQYSTSSSIKIPEKAVYAKLARECSKYHQFDLIDVIASGHDGSDVLKWGGVGAVIAICFILFIAFGLDYVPAFVARFFKMLWRGIPSWVKGYWDMASHFLVLVVYANIISSGHYRLFKIRNSILQISKLEGASGGEWGYGQTTAVLVWAPFLLYVMRETIRYVMNSKEPENPQPEASSEKDTFPAKTAKQPEADTSAREQPNSDSHTLSSSEGRADA